MAPISDPVDRPIMLVGMMGAGKSTVGRLLAERLDLPFIDSDEEVERETGLRIPDIFARFGEERFRREERRVLMRLAEGPPRVVASGGGAFEDPVARAMIHETCVTVWLDAGVETLSARTEGGGDRPLLAGSDRRSSIAALEARRNSQYAEAQLKVSAEGTAAQTAEAVLDALKDRVR
jgi:shikimate kinase